MVEPLEPDCPEGYPPIEHPEVTARKMIRKVMDSGAVDRLYHIGKGLTLRKTELDRLTVLMRDVLFPAFRLVLQMKKERARGKKFDTKDPDPNPGESFEVIDREYQNFKKSQAELRRAQRARAGGGLEREENGTTE